MENVDLRCAVISDVPFIVKLKESSPCFHLQDVEVLQLLETANLSVTVTENQENILAHASFVDYPNLPPHIVDSSEWVQWMSNHLNHIEVTACNCLFLHLFVCQPHCDGYLKEILTELFRSASVLKYCMMFSKKEFDVGEAIRNVFVLEDVDFEEFNLWVTCREVYVSQLLIRPARVEDSDKVNQLIGKHTNEVMLDYGEYFLSDLITKQDRTTFAAVAEVKDTLIGFMYASTNVDVEFLNECFELESYYGLRKPHPDDSVNSYGVPETTPKPSSSSLKDLYERVGSLQLSRIHSRQSSCLSGSSTRGSLLLRRRISAPRIEDPFKYVPLSRQASEVVERGLKFSGPPKHKIPSLPLYYQPIIPQYNGESNCFAIHLFSVSEENDSRSVDLVEAAFEKFSELEYCVLLMPYTVGDFALLQHFMRVPARAGSVFPHALFVIHKAAFLRDFHVRYAKDSDLQRIKQLIQTLWWADSLWIDLKFFCRAPSEEDRGDLEAFVAECQGQIIGTAVLRKENRMEYIEAHFNVDEFIFPDLVELENHGRLIHCFLNSAFKPMSKLFLKEIMRLSHKSCLYYPVYPAHTTAYNESLWQSVCTILEDFIPLKPRKAIQYDLSKLFEFHPSEEVLRKDNFFCIYHINRKLTFSQKFIIHARIVVVGASEVALGFLEALVFKSHLEFTNLTLVSRRGLPGELAPDEKRNTFLPISINYSEDILDKLCLHGWVNVVYGTMTNIDRNTKIIEINEIAELPYDYLVLCCGTQYQRPRQPRIATSPSGETVIRRISSLENRTGNIHTVNDVFEAAVALNWLGDHFALSKGQAIVYGNSLEAYICIEALLKVGILGLRIAFVKSPEDPKNPCFKNKDIEAAMITIMTNLEISIFEDHVLELRDKKNTITSVIIRGPEHQRTLPCSVLFLCRKKEVDYFAFKAAQRSNLVFDGRLVIDSSFRTNDSYIYAAGSFTRLSNRYFVENWNHVNFNSKEVGFVLAEKIINLFYPSNNTLSSMNDTDELPVFKQPKVLYAKLPCGWNYLIVDKPRQELLKPQNGTQEKQILTTGNLDPNGSGYFSLQFDEHCKVETITCFTKEEIDARNLVRLHGIHYSFLNKIFFRFQDGQITDLFDYFREPWCLALYHDCFSDLRKNIGAIVSQRKDPGVQSLAEKANLMAKMKNELSRDHREILKKTFKNQGYCDDIKENLRHFVYHYRHQLTMLPQPGWRERFEIQDTESAHSLTCCENENCSQ